MEVQKRVVWIDVLKGIACLVVACGHFVIAFNGASSATKIAIDVVFRPFFNGGLMVCIFAILSGYLSSFSLGKKFVLVKRLIRRYLQLMLPILATGLIVFALWNTIGFAPENVRLALGGGAKLYLLRKINIWRNII